MPPGEKRETARDQPGGGALTDLAMAVTELGKLPGYLFLLLGVAAAAPTLAARALGLLVVSDLICLGLKRIFRVARPSGPPPPTSRLDAHAGYSFPSCHSLNGATILGFLAAESGSVVMAALLLGALAAIAVSRLVLRHHRVIDVLAGLALGTALQWSARLLGW